MRISFASSAASGDALRVDHELGDPRAVAEVDEDEPAVVAPARDPAGERQRPADVLGARLAAHEVAPAHVRQSADDLVVADRLVGAAGASQSVAVVGRPRPSRAAPSRAACVSWPLSERPA